MPPSAKPRFLLDCDGILADFVGAYLYEVELETGRKVAREEIDRWSIQDVLKLTQDEQDNISLQVVKRGFCHGLQVLEGAKEGVALLQEVADVYVVTAPWPNAPFWAHEREEWLKKHFDIGHKRVISAHAKNLVFGRYLLDDKHDNVASWQADWGHRGGHAILWNTPHNVNDVWSIRTSSWKQLVSWIEGGEA